MFLLYRDSWTSRSSPRHWPIGLGLGTSQHALLDLATLLCQLPPPKKRNDMLQLVQLYHCSYLGRGFAPNNGVRVGLVLKAGLFVSNPKFMDGVFEYSILTQAVGAVSCRHEFSVCCLLELTVRGSDVRVLDLGPVSRHYKRVSLCLPSARLSHTRCRPSFFCASSTQSQSQGGGGVSQFNCFVCKDKYFWAPRYSPRPWPKSQSQVNCRPESSSSLVLAHLSRQGLQGEVIVSHLAGVRHQYF